MFMVMRDEEYIIVVALDTISPFDKIDKLEEELKIYEELPIIFDLLLCNGLNENRFMYCKSLNDLMNPLIVPTVPKRIRDRLYLFYKRNEDLVNTSILPNAHKYIILNGIL